MTTFQHWSESYVLFASLSCKQILFFRHRTTTFYCSWTSFLFRLQPKMSERLILDGPICCSIYLILATWKSLPSFEYPVWLLLWLKATTFEQVLFESFSQQSVIKLFALQDHYCHQISIRYPFSLHSSSRRNLVLFFNSTSHKFCTSLQFLSRIDATAY